MFRRIHSLASLLIVAGLAFVSQSLSAEPRSCGFFGGGWSVGPIPALPGETVTLDFYFVNEESSGRLGFQSIDYWRGPESWPLQIDGVPVFTNPGETGEFSISVTVPQNADQGIYEFCGNIEGAEHPSFIYLVSCDFRIEVTCDTTVSPSSMHFDSAGTQVRTASVSGDAGCSWRVTRPSWINVSASSGSGPKSITISADPNVSSESRSGTIYIGDEAIAVSQSGIAPAPIEFLHSVAEIPELREPVSLGNNPAICTDQSMVTILRFSRNGLGTSSYSIRRVPQGGGAATSVTAEEIQHLSSEQTLAVRITHPNYGSCGEAKELPVAYEVVRNGIVYARGGARLVPTAVGLVHGLWGNADSMDELRDSLLDSSDSPWSGATDAQVRLYNYAESNAAAFDANRNVAYGAALAQIRDLRSAGVSAGRIDLVGHSMGGLLARLGRQNPEQRFVLGRVLTINSPHSGSHLANYLRGGTPGSIASSSGNQWLSTMASIGMAGNSAAIRDLALGSAALAQLNNVASQSPIYGHAITTTTPFPPTGFGPTYFVLNNAIRRAAILDGWVPAGANAAQTNAAAAQFLQAVFGSSEHDLIVSQASQTGGLPSSQRTAIPGIIHMSTSEVEVAESVRQLLAGNADPFDTQNFNPTTLSYSYTPKREHAPARGNGNVFFSFPNAPKTYSCGETMNFTVAANPTPATIALVGVLHGEIVFYHESSGPFPAQFSFPRPSNRATSQSSDPLIVYAIAEGEGSDWTSAQFHAGLADCGNSASTAEAVPPSLLLTPGRTARVDLIAHYGSESVTIPMESIATSPIVSRQSLNASVATFDAEGRVVAAGLGNTELRFTVDGRTVSVPVRVTQSGNLDYRSPVWIEFSPRPDSITVPYRRSFVRMKGTAGSYAAYIYRVEMKVGSGSFTGITGGASFSARIDLEPSIPTTVLLRATDYRDYQSSEKSFTVQRLPNGTPSPVIRMLLRLQTPSYSVDGNFDDVLDAGDS